MSTKHASAGASEAIGDLEGGDERHDLAHELHHSLVVAEQIAEDLNHVSLAVDARVEETHILRRYHGDHDHNTDDDTQQR